MTNAVKRVPENAARAAGNSVAGKKTATGANAIRGGHADEAESLSVALHRGEEVKTVSQIHSPMHNATYTATDADEGMVPSSSPSPQHRYVLGMRVDGTSYTEATGHVLAWAQAAQPAPPRYVCAANVHMTMETYDDPAFAQIVNAADLVTPDGVPLVWALTRLGVEDATRVYGPTLTLHVCEAAARSGVPIGLYGGTTESLIAFAEFLQKHYPAIKIVCRIAPPFRPLTSEEDQAYSQQVIESKARILFVGIGCPKQERWMAAHKERFAGVVMLGVGAAFDFHSGRIKQAPGWMQRAGLEWLFRLLMEPRRLMKRYGKHNPRFLVLFALQLLGLQRHIKEAK